MLHAFSSLLWQFILLLPILCIQINRYYTGKNLWIKKEKDSMHVSLGGFLKTKQNCALSFLDTEIKMQFQMDLFTNEEVILMVNIYLLELLFKYTI